MFNAQNFSPHLNKFSATDSLKHFQQPEFGPCVPTLFKALPQYISKIVF